jgi:IS5 family transposase
LTILPPDNSTLSRLRTELTQKRVYEQLFKSMNKQLEKHQIIVKKGVLVDASITDSPLRPKGKANYEIVTDREQEDISEQEITAVKIVRVNSTEVDAEPAWIKKRLNSDMATRNRWSQMKKIWYWDFSPRRQTSTRSPI